MCRSRWPAIVATRRAAHRTEDRPRGGPAGLQGCKQRGGGLRGSGSRVAHEARGRPGELRQMRWEDVDLEASEWRFTATKTGTPHIVPLAPQVIAIISDLRLLTGAGEWVFRGLRGARPISDMALGAALRRRGLDTRTGSRIGSVERLPYTDMAASRSYRPD